MKKLLIATILIAIGTLGCERSGSSKFSLFGPKDPIDKKVQDLLKKMTVEEKVGQMTQITLEPFAASGKDGFLKLDPEKLRAGIVDRHIGSILNCGGQARTVENWQEIITEIQDMATKQTRLGIPIIYGIDTIHGANYITGATIFPQNIAMAATGNADLMKTVGEIAALETRAAGIPWNFAPVLGLGRQPMWSRLWETFGEDAYIASVMGAAYVRGQQEPDLSMPSKVAVCMKHYLGYSVPLSGMDRTPAWIPERQLRQLFLKPFAAAAQAGAASAMVNSSEINGIPVHSSRFLLNDVLIEELGMDGFVVSDWADIENLYTREMVAADRREAVKMSVMAGIDMSMVPYDYSFYDTLLELVKAKKVPMSRINEAVARILRVKFRLGLFERPYPDPLLAGSFASPQFANTNLQAAREAITLLKNDSKTLPLSKDIKVLVTGPTADKLSVLNGGWTITWQGDKEELYPAEKDTILEAIKKKLGEDNVTFVQAVDFDKAHSISSAVTAAEDADVVIACLGEPTYCETPGNIDDLTLSAPQLELIEQLAETGKPIVMVLAEGRPRVIRTIVDDAKAIVMAYLPGMEGGTAIADILFGDANPSGKLPFSYPKWASYHVCYDHKPSEEKGGNKYDPQWPFGFGMSYTTFAYSNLILDKTEMTEGGVVTVSVDLSNTGEIAGSEIVQLYLSDLVASVTPAVKSLKRFTKVSLEPGQSKTVIFMLGWDDLAFIGRDNKPVIEPGKFKVAVSSLSQEFEIK